MPKDPHPQVLQAGVEREPGDRRRQHAIDGRDRSHEEPEVPLVGVGPAQLHLLPEGRGQETRGHEPVERAEGRADRPGQVVQRHEPLQVFADRRVDPDPGHGGRPVPLEPGPVGRPHVLGHLQRGGERPALAVDGVRGDVVDRAVQQGVHVGHAPVQARGHPQLKARVERAIGDRAARGRADARVRAVHLPPADRAFLRGAQQGHRQVRDRAPDPPDRVPHDLTALDRALQHAVPDPGLGELHHHVRGTGQQRRAVDHVPDVVVRFDLCRMTQSEPLTKSIRPRPPEVYRRRDTWSGARNREPPTAGAIPGATPRNREPLLPRRYRWFHG